MQTTKSALESSLANILFNTPPVAHRAAAEEEIIDRLTVLVAKLSASGRPELVDEAIVRADEKLVGYLSGSNTLKLARLIDKLRPDSISSLKNLGRMEQHLRQVQQISAIFSVESLNRLIDAIDAEEMASGSMGG